MNKNTLRKLISAGLLLALIVVFTLSSDYFLTLNNFMEIFRDASVVGIMGIGVTMVILTAGIDLSTGSMMALVGMTMANIYRYTLWPIWLMILAGIAVGADGLFIETHENPAVAKSDGANMLKLDLLEGLLTRLVRIREAIK